jgi:hypothetical protein
MEHLKAPHIDLLTMIDAHCAKSGMSKSSFGLKAVGDPSFVAQLERGREPRRRVVARVMEFIITGRTHAEAREGTAQGSAA